MLGLGSIKTWIIFGVAGVVASMGAALYWQNTVIEGKNDEITIISATLTAEQTAHQLTTASFENTINELANMKEAVGILNSNLRNISEENHELESKLARHDLEALSLAKPSLIENIINNATQDVMDRIEELTGGSQ